MQKIKVSTTLRNNNIQAKVPPEERLGDLGIHRTYLVLPMLAQPTLSSGLSSTAQFDPI